MPARILPGAIVAACLIGGLFAASLRGLYARADDGADVPGPSTWRQDEIIVKFSEDADQTTRDTLLRQHGCHVSRTCEHWDVHLVKIPEGRAPEDMVRDFLEHELVQYAELDYQVRLFFVPDDPYFR